MTTRLEQSLLEQKQQTKQEVPQIPGILGIPLGGQRLVEVPDRNAYVYVRLRNNQSEVIQAFNNQVAASYNLPVLVERQGNRYVVIGVDTQRYENNWTSFAPFLPRHGNTHSFDIESGGGGDIVWVYPRQFMPALVFPSGSVGGPNVVVSPYTLKNDNGTWRYVGNTGTQNITSYRPSSPTGAVMGLVYLNTDDGNPYFFINSGTVFSNAITGTSQIYPYIPSVTNPATQIPLAAIRLITGTATLSWDNIYDVRQFIHNTPTGTGGGGSITVQDEGVSQGAASVFNFVGDNVQATVSGGTARIFVTGSIGGGGINTGTLDARYLKLDASNDPVTGELQINVVRNVLTANNYALEVIGENTASPLNGIYIESKNHNAIDAVVHGDNYFASVNKELPTGTADSTPILDFYRYSRGTGTILNAPAFHLTDYQGGMEPQSGFLKHIYDFTGSTPNRTLFEINPYAIPTGVVIWSDTLNAITDQGRLLLLRNQGEDKFYVNGSGTAYSNGSPLVKEAPTITGSFVRNRAGWINQNPLFLPFGVYTSTPPLSANGAPYSASVDRIITLVKWTQSYFAIAPNDGTNYWQIDLIVVTPGNVGTVVATFNTSSGYTSSTWARSIISSFSPVSTVDPSSYPLVYMLCTKVNNPGNLYLGGPIVEVSV